MDIFCDGIYNNATICKPDFKRLSTYIYFFGTNFSTFFFRNSEIISSILGRSVTNENFITINLEDDSIFRSLRIMTFRKNIGNHNLKNNNEIINLIDKVNKEREINLIVLNFNDLKKINEKLEKYLIDLNKKVLIISKNEIEFNNYFLNRQEFLSDYYLTYFNNDVQYGSKYILKRAIDISLGILFILTFFLFIFLQFSI